MYDKNSKKVKFKYSGANYLRDYEASRRLANQLRDYYRNSPLYSQVDVRVIYEKGIEAWVIRSNIARLMENVARVEDRVKM